MALVFAATVTSRWFVAPRGLVIGILTAGSATGQLIFLPVIAGLAADARLAGRVAGDRRGRAGRRAARAARAARLPVATVGPAVAYGRPPSAPATARAPTDPAVQRGAPRAIVRLREAAHGRTFWAARRRLRDLRRDHQRADRHPLRPGRARPRDAADHGRRPARARRHLRHRRHDRVRAGSPTGSTRGSCSVAYYSLPRRWRCCCCRSLLAAVVHAEHAGVHHLLRAGLGGDRAADRRPVPRALRRRRADRVRLGLRLAPDRRRDRRRWRRPDARPDRHYTVAWFGAGGLCVVAAVLSLGIRRDAASVTV